VEEALTSFVLVFDQATDRGVGSGVAALVNDPSGMGGGASTAICEGVISAATLALLPGAVCSWQQDRFFLVQADPPSAAGAWHVFAAAATDKDADTDTASAPPPTDIVVLANVIRISPATGLSSAAAGQMSAPLLAPFRASPVTAILSGPAAIASCSAVTLDASLSAGGGGRAFAYAFAVVPDGATGLTDAEYNELNLHLSTYNDLLGQPESPQVYVPDTYLPPNRTYVFRVSIRNWLGDHASALASVAKLPMEVPVVGLVGGPGLRTMRLGDTLVLEGLASLSTCVGATTLEFAWTKAAGPTYYIAENQQTSASISLTGLIPTETYSFEFHATSRVSDQSTGDFVAVDVYVEPVPVPQLTSAVLGFDAVTGSANAAGGQLTIAMEWNLDTDRAGMTPRSGCEEVLTAGTLARIDDGSSPPSCAWTSSRRLVVTLDGAVASLELGEYVVRSYIHMNVYIYNIYI
jgi:hypothetical protein